MVDSLPDNPKEPEHSSDGPAQSMATRVVRRIPIRGALIIPFTLIIVMTVGLTGYLSFKNGQRQVHELAGQLMNEISGRIEEQLHSLMERPHILNRIHSNAIRMEGLNPADVRSQERHYWAHVQGFQDISHTFFANTAGDFIGSRVLSDGSVGTMLGDASTEGNREYHYYRTDELGNPTDLMLTRPKIDVRKRPWYQKAIEDGGPTWSPIYTVIDTKAPAITASQPIYDRNGELVGVVGSNLVMSHIRHFLGTMVVGKHGVVFIMDRSGLMVGSSTSDPNTTPVAGKSMRVAAEDSSNPVIRQAATNLKRFYPDLKRVHTQETRVFTMDNAHHFLQVVPFTDNRGLNWLVVITVPVNDFMARINVNNRVTFGIVLVALFMAIITGVVMSRWILAPISQLNQTAVAMAQGEWDQVVKVNRKDELGQLAESFNIMVKHITSLFRDLNRSVIGLEREVDHRKLVEEELRENEERYRLLFNSGSDALFVHVPRDDGTPGLIIEANDAAHAMYGYSRKDFYEMTVHDLADTEPDPAAQDKVPWLPHQEQSVCEQTHKRHDGSTFPVEVTAHLFDFHGRPTILSMVRDITERKEMELERRSMADQLQQTQKLESIGTLAGGIAHDFNNILSSIIGYTELAEEMVEDGSELNEYLREVDTAGKRAKELVKQILAFARLSNEENKPIRVDTIIEEVLTFIRSSIPSTIEITRNINSSRKVMGNATQVYQILMNLCTNAAQAMETEGGSLDVTLKNIVIEGSSMTASLGLDGGEYVMIRVSDTGPGIPEEIQDTIFDPYFTTKAPGEGTGMGLSMVHGIVKSYGGKVSVESSLGNGAIFCVYLPVCMAEEAEEHPTPSGDAPSGLEHILLVDDEAPITKMLQHMLEHLGYTVTTRHHSMDALDLVKSDAEAFDLVISDMTMPVMTGDELARELLKIRPNLPIIVCTGYSKKISEESFKKIGIKAVAFKPIIKKDLAWIVRKVLDDAKTG